MSEEKFELNLKPYEFEFTKIKLNEKTKEPEEVSQKLELDVKDELYKLLRGNGVFKTGAEMVEAVYIARDIRDCKEDAIKLVESDHNLIKNVLNHYIGIEHKPEIGQVSLGGPRYEELILRVFAK